MSIPHSFSKSLEIPAFNHSYTEWRKKMPEQSLSAFVKEFFLGRSLAPGVRYQVASFLFSDTSFSKDFSFTKRPNCIDLIFKSTWKFKEEDAEELHYFGSGLMLSPSEDQKKRYLISVERNTSIANFNRISKFATMNDWWISEGGGGLIPISELSQAEAHLSMLSIFEDVLRQSEDIKENFYPCITSESIAVDVENGRYVGKLNNSQYKNELPPLKAISNIDFKTLRGCLNDFGFGLYVAPVKPKKGAQLEDESEYYSTLQDVLDQLDHLEALLSAPDETIDREELEEAYSLFLELVRESQAFVSGLTLLKILHHAPGATSDLSAYFQVKPLGDLLIKIGFHKIMSVGLLKDVVAFLSKLLNGEEEGRIQPLEALGLYSEILRKHNLRGKIEEVKQHQEVDELVKEFLFSRLQEEVEANRRLGLFTELTTLGLEPRESLLAHLMQPQFEKLRERLTDVKFKKFAIESYISIVALRICDRYESKTISSETNKDMLRMRDKLKDDLLNFFLSDGLAVDFPGMTVHLEAQFKNLTDGQAINYDLMCKVVEVSIVRAMNMRFSAGNAIKRKNKGTA